MKTPRSRRFWLGSAWITGTILALAIMLALGSTVQRLQRSLSLLDQPDITAESFLAMTEASLAWTKCGLLIGVATAPFYLFSLVQVYRRRSS